MNFPYQILELELESSFKSAWLNLYLRTSIFYSKFKEKQIKKENYRRPSVGHKNGLAGHFRLAEEDFNHP